MKKIAICIPTYRGEKSLKPLLDSLNLQRGNTLHSFSLSIIVVINTDDTNKAYSFLDHYKVMPPFCLRAVQEPQAGYVHVRNRCLREAARHDAVIFVDDDMTVPEDWLDALLQTFQRFPDRMITGPVRAVFSSSDHVPSWVIKSRTFESWRDYETGTAVSKAYTSNVLIPAIIFNKENLRFDEDFSSLGSEDIHFFRSARRAGYSIVWCREALAYAHISQDRMRLLWLARRSFREGLGDSLSLRKTDCSPFAPIKILSMGGLRFLNGIALMMIGAVILNARFFIKGYRRFFSSLGTVFYGWFSKRFISHAKAEFKINDKSS